MLGIPVGANQIPERDLGELATDGAAGKWLADDMGGTEVPRCGQQGERRRYEEGKRRGALIARSDTIHRGHNPAQAREPETFPESGTNHGCAPFNRRRDRDLSGSMFARLAGPHW